MTDHKKAQLSLTNPRDAKACQKLLQFHVLTTLSLTIGLLVIKGFTYLLTYLFSFLYQLLLRPKSRKIL